MQAAVIPVSIEGGDPLGRLTTPRPSASHEVGRARLQAHTDRRLPRLRPRRDDPVTQQWAEGLR